LPPPPPRPPLFPYTTLFPILKRIRPIELGTFNYEREVRTVNLWWSEGVTDYYADLILARAGLNTPADFARRLARSMENFQNDARSEEHTSELQSRFDLVCRLL